MVYIMPFDLHDLIESMGSYIYLRLLKCGSAINWAEWGPFERELLRRLRRLLRELFTSYYHDDDIRVLILGDLVRHKEATNA